MYFFSLLIFSILLYSASSRGIKAPSYLIVIGLTLFTGLRQGIGGDWIEYLRLYNVIRADDFSLTGPWIFELGYYLTAKTSPTFTVWNLMMAMLSLGTLYYAAKNIKLQTFRLLLPLGFLLLFIISYTGFVRQGVAASFFALAMTSIIWNKKLLFPCLAILVGLSFHNPFKVIVNTGSLQQYVQIESALTTSKLTVAPTIEPLTSTPSEQADRLSESTATSEIRYQSKGVSFRILFLTSLVLVFLIFKKASRKMDLELKLLLFLSCGLLALLTANQFVAGISTPIDRVIYYIIPFFFLVLSKKLDNHNPSFKTDWLEISLIAFSCLFSLSWFFLSDHSLSYKWQ